MRTRTMLLLAFAAIFAAFVGGVAGVVLIAFANPGVKGPNVDSDMMNAAFVAGAVAGVALVAIARIGWSRWKRAPLGDTNDVGVAK